MDSVTTLAMKSANKFKVHPQEGSDLMTTLDSQGLPNLPMWARPVPLTGFVPILN